MENATEATPDLHHCLGCGRRITSAESIAAGRGSGCRARVRRAARTADLSAWTPAQVAEARQAIEDGAVIPSSRAGVFHVVSADGSEAHLTHRDGCNCRNGLSTRPPRPCWHRAAVAMVLAASAPAGGPHAALAPRTALPVPMPRPAVAEAAPADVWAALEAVGATGAPDFIPAF